MTLKSSNIVDDISKKRLIKVKAISAVCESCFHPVSFFRLFKNNYDKNAADDHLCITHIKNQTKLLDFLLELVIKVNRHTNTQTITFSADFLS